MEEELARAILEELASKRVRLISEGVDVPFLSIERELCRCAEATIYRGKLLGLDVVVKLRLPKAYRLKEFNEWFVKRRTEVEARILVRALKLGIPVPIPLYVDVERGVLVLQLIDGEVLRDLVPKLSDDEVCRYLELMGVYAAKLHEAGVVHGDLTTSNAMVSSGKLYLIDFGLSEYSSNIEDQAVDVHILFRSIESTHFDREELMKKCFTEGYSKVRGENVAKLVLSKVREIRLRGRYVEERRKKVELVWRL